MIAKATAVTVGAFKTADSAFLLSADKQLHIINDTYLKILNNCLACASPEIGFKAHPFSARLHAMGVTTTLFTAGPVANRIEKITDPLDAAKVCWKMQAQFDDPDTASTNAKRGEFNFPCADVFVSGRTYTLGFKFMLPDYRTATDSFAFCQFHGADSIGGYSPFLSFNIQAGDLAVQVAYENAEATDSFSTFPYRVADWVPDVWHTVVAVLTTDSGAGGYLRVLLDNTEIVELNGPMGYRDIVGSYLKAGIYQWGGVSWPWDGNFPLKTSYLKGPYLNAGDVSAEMQTFLASQ